MLIKKMSNMIRGWFIGDFKPSILRTDKFEVGILTHKKGEYWPPHFHKEAIEYNVLLEGKMKVQETIINTEDIFIFKKGEIADPEFLEDCKVLVVKVPSIPRDKYEVF
tara:strand:- start:291 stop:614 length:324 start_codon:yes stop_codon:yes gene_type:complete